MIKDEMMLCKLDGILDNFIIQLPSFQRAYTWTKMDVLQFLNDVLNKTNGNEYFIGVIYYVKNGKTISIIDGQQRLTTLFLILNAIRMIDPNSFNSIGLSFFDDDKPKFDIEKNSPFCSYLFQCNSNEELKNEIQNTSELNFSKVNLYVNFNIIYNEILKCTNYPTLLNNIILNLKMCFIECKDLEFGSQIFENINSKGQGLTNIDLIKNAYFSRINNKQGEKEDNSFKYKTWNAIENNFFPKINLEMSNNKLKLINDRSMKEFHQLFSIFMLLKNKKKVSNKSKRLYVKYIEQLNMCDQIQLKFEMSELLKLSKEIKYVNNLFDQSMPCYEFVQRHIIFLRNYLKIKMLTPFLLALIDALEDNRYRNKSDINKLLIKISLFHFVFNTIYSMRPSIIEKFYNNIAYDIYTTKISFKKIKNYFSDQYIDILKYIQTKDLSENLESVLFTLDRASKEVKKAKGYKKFYDANAIKHIFGIMECYLKNDYVTVIIVDTVEHINNLSGDGKDEISNFNIFNLLPMEKYINEECSAKTMEEKVELYKKSNYVLVKKYCELYDAFKDNIHFKWKEYVSKLILDIINNDL